MCISILCVSSFYTTSTLFLDVVERSCPAAAPRHKKKKSTLCVSAYHYICVLYMCTIYVSSYCSVCPHTARGSPSSRRRGASSPCLCYRHIVSLLILVYMLRILVYMLLILVYMLLILVYSVAPHTSIYAVYYYICYMRVTIYDICVTIYDILYMLYACRSSFYSVYVAVRTLVCVSISADTSVDTSMSDSSIDC